MPCLARKSKHKVISPEEVHRQKLAEGRLSFDAVEVHLTSSFVNIAPLRPYMADEFKVVRDDLEQFKSKLGQEHSNSFLDKGELREIICSSDPEIVVGKIYFAGVEDAVRAVQASEAAYREENWAEAPWPVRSSVLLKAGQSMLKHRTHLMSLMVYEAGKSMVEALADVDEAIDFLHFYAREEAKFYNSDNRGPIVAVTPWNFPLAIPTGMVAGPLAAGNSVILKSAGQTPLIANSLVDIFHQAGVPRNILIHLPGPGSTVGKALIESPQVAGVVFTGSKEVGSMIVDECRTRIYENKRFGKSFPRKVITEMGGKNAIVVTANAELDETVSGIIYSAFGHAGQKCSAASRVIVHNKVKDRLIERLKEAALDIEVSEAFKFSCAVNPVVSKKEWLRLKRDAKEAIAEVREHGGQVVIERLQEDLPGYCVAPVILELPFKRALMPQSFAQRELFGPILHIVGFDTPDGAIKLFNSTEYALTGGIFSQSQDEIDYYTERMQVGNIYVNRGITGARVAVEPFGGFKMSGTGPKAGGSNYLPSFHLLKKGSATSVAREEEGSEEQCFLVSGIGLDRHQCASASMRVLELILTDSSIRADKDYLQAFKKWGDGNLLHLSHTRHPNHKIAGQLSYSDFSLSSGSVVVLSLSPDPSTVTLVRVLSALAMGVGVSVLARNQEAHTWWEQLLKVCKAAGIKTSQFALYFASEKQLGNILEDASLSFVLLDGPVSLFSKVGKMLEVKNERDRVVQILSNDDIHGVYDFKYFCLQFVCERAFAVNTIRHGAPLDLDF